MSNDIAIITAIYDRYDTLKPALPQKGTTVEWVCVTDEPGLPDEYLGWKIIHEPRLIHANRAAKRPKYRPWEYTQADASVWIDASFRITSDRFAAEAMSYADPIAQFVHPWRDCLYTEASASADLFKYAGEPVREQAAHYRELQHPERWGLWATGVIARRHTEPVRELGGMWTEETHRWSFQDQISQPYVLRLTGLRPDLLPGTHFANPWLSYEGSERH